MNVAVRSDLGASGEGVAEILDSARRLSWRAPEVTLVLANQVLGSTELGPEQIAATELLAEVLNRLGRPAEAIERLLPALAHAETSAAAAETAAQLKIELARSAVEVGEPGIALGHVREVLADDSIPETLRTTALLPAASALSALRDDEAAQDVNVAADACFAEQRSGDPATAVLLRARLRAQRAAAHRRAGHGDAAEDDARAGLALLVSLPDRDRDAGEVDGWLALELVHVLLDHGADTEATEVAEEFLARPVRAGSAAPIGWLRIAIATRVHLPAGDYQRATDLLADAIRGAERHRADAMLADALDGLSKVLESQGELAEALDNLRKARATERRMLLEDEAARTLLVARYGSHRAAAEHRTEIVDLARALVPEPVLASPLASPVETTPEQPIVGSAEDHEYDDHGYAEAEQREPEPAGFEWSSSLEPIPDLPQHPALDPATSFDPETGLVTDVPAAPRALDRLGPAGARHGDEGAIPVSQLINRVAGGPDRIFEDRVNAPGRHQTPRTLQPPLGSLEVLPGGIEPDESETDEYFPRPLAPEHDTDRTGIIDEVDDGYPPPAPAPRPFDDWPLGHGDEKPRMGDLLAEAMVAFQHTGHTDPLPTVVADDFGRAEEQPEPPRRESSTDPIFVAVEEESRALAARRARRSVGS